MLIQITNRCSEGCPHCMQNSLPDGPHMSLSVFRAAVAFGRFLKCNVYVISGGEPTEHPQFLDFCQILNDSIGKNGKAAISVTSNGMWYPEKKDMIEKLAKLKNFIGMQVYTNRQWYRNYDRIIRYREEIDKMAKVTVDTAPLFMQDLGRARFNEEAQKASEQNPHFMSCLNGHLLIKQASPLRRLDGMMIPNALCKPLIDFRGNVHLSESCLCPSFGNVAEDLHMEIFRNMQEAKPCLRCAGGKRFKESQRLDILKAKEILEI